MDVFRNILYPAQNRIPKLLDAQPAHLLECEKSQIFSTSVRSKMAGKIPMGAVVQLMERVLGDCGLDLPHLPCHIVNVASFSGMCTSVIPDIFSERA